MLKSFLFLLSIFLLSAFAHADDLKLRIETFGYEDAKVRSGDRKQIVLRSIETRVTPGRRFSASCRCGKQRMELHGSCAQDNNSKVTIEIHYKHMKTPYDVLQPMGPNGRTFPVELTGTSIQTTLTFEPGDSFTVGGVTSAVSENAKDSKLFSANRIVATLFDSDTTKNKVPRSLDQPKSR